MDFSVDSVSSEPTVVDRVTDISNDILFPLSMQNYMISKLCSFQVKFGRAKLVVKHEGEVHVVTPLCQGTTLKLICLVSAKLLLASLLDHLFIKMTSLIAECQMSYVFL